MRENRKKHLLSGICGLFLTIILSLGMLYVLPEMVYADGEGSYIESNGMVSENGLQDLESYADGIHSEYGVSVYFLNYENQGVEDLIDTTDTFISGHSSGGDCFVFSINDDMWYITGTDGVSALITDELQNQLWDAYNGETTYYDGIRVYLEQVNELFAANLEPIATDAADTAEAASDTAQHDTLSAEEETSAEPEQSTQVIPDERQLPRLVDNADLLTDREEEKLLAKLDEISEHHEMDVAVVTVNSLEGKTPEAYADDFYDYNGYGMGENDDGVLLLVAMDSRDWQISTHGFGITAFDDESKKYIEKKVVSDLSDGAYADAFDAYATAADKLITAAKKGKTFHGFFAPDAVSVTAGVIMGVIVGLIASAVTGIRSWKRLHTVRRRKDAFAYLSGGADLHISEDHFLNRTVTKRHIERDTGGSRSSGGHSTTHTSSSGRTHGGYGGKF